MFTAKYRGFLKTVLVISGVIILSGTWPLMARAEKLESSDLTVAPICYQPDFLSSVDEAVSVFNGFKGFFSSWSGGEIKQMAVDRMGVRIVSALPQSGEERVSIPAGNITKIQLLQFPFLERDFVWGVDVQLKDGTNFDLRAKDYDIAKKLADALATLAVINGVKLPPEFGFTTQTTNLAAQFSRLKWDKTGIWVTAVFPESPAGKAGLLIDDIIFEANGQPVGNPAAFKDVVDMALNNTPETIVKLQVFRAEQVIPLQLKVKNFSIIGAQLINTSQKPTVVQPVQPSLGIGARDLTTDEASKAGLPTASGVVVTSVDPGSLAEQMGLKAGDYLIEVNGSPLADKNALKQILASGVIQSVKVWRAGAIIKLNGVDKL